LTKLVRIDILVIISHPMIRMPQVNIYQAKTHLSQLVEQARHGDTVIIAKSGKPVAKLVALNSPNDTFCFGTLTGKIHIRDDFDKPLPDEILDEFEAG